jgi:hypothetical protein
MLHYFLLQISFQDKMSAPPTEEELCRKLTGNEQMWLAQSSLICVIADVNINKGTTIDVANVQAAVSKVRATQPYLNVCIDPEAMSFKLCGDMPITEETLDAYDKQSVRDAARRQLLLGVDRNATFARIHITTSADGKKKHLMAFCDHLAFDAKSLIVLLTDILKLIDTLKLQKQLQDSVALDKAEAIVEEMQEFAGTADGIPSALGGGLSHSEPDTTATATATATTMLPFVEWSSMVPEVELPPFEGVDSILLKTKALAVAPEELGSLPGVEGVVFSVTKETFAALKEASKSRGLTLNGPLMTAFLASVTECARKQAAAAETKDDSSSGSGSTATAIRSCCAVDLRRNLKLPSNYMNNSSSVVKCSAVIPPSAEINGTLLWEAAAESSKELTNSIDAHEGYRLHDITKRMAFAEMGPIFNIPCLWSNVGHIESCDTINECEVFIHGAGSNHILSGHCVEVAGSMSLTVSYAPAFHDVATANAIGARFLEYVGLLAAAAI